MYYSASVASLTAYGASVQLPRHSLLWLMARVMLDGAGALFAVYLLIAVVLLLAGRVMRHRTTTESHPVDGVGLRCA